MSSVHTPCRCGPEGCADSSCPGRVSDAERALDVAIEGMAKVNAMLDENSARLMKAAAAELRRLAAEVDRAHEARRQAQTQREADYTRLMAEAKREQRERGKAERERDLFAELLVRFESIAVGRYDDLERFRAELNRLAALSWFERAAIDAAKAKGAA